MLAPSQLTHQLHQLEYDSRRSVLKDGAVVERYLFCQTPTLLVPLRKLQGGPPGEPQSPGWCG